MRSKKLDNTVAELHKLKNQIRVELNKIRPYKPPPSPQKRSTSAKKRYPQRSHSTSLFGPPQEIIPVQRPQKKKMFERPPQNRGQQIRQITRKHFNENFKDQIKLKATTRRTSSSYLNIRPENSQKSVSGAKQRHNTSLMGVGANDKSNSPHRPAKVIVNKYHLYNFQFF